MNEPGKQPAQPAYNQIIDVRLLLRGEWETVD